MKKDQNSLVCRSAANANRPLRGQSRSGEPMLSGIGEIRNPTPDRVGSPKWTPRQNGLPAERGIAFAAERQTREKFLGKKFDDIPPPGVFQKNQTSRVVF